MDLLPTSGTVRHIGHVTTGAYLNMLDEFSTSRAKEHVAKKEAQKETNRALERNPSESEALGR
jgi:hypothetical protein